MLVVSMGSVPNERQINSPQTPARSKCQAIRDVVSSKEFGMFLLKVIFILLCIPLVISTVFFSIFDAWCSLYERASVSNCSQSFFVPHPRQWISAWLVMSIISPCLFMFIIYWDKTAFNFQGDQFRKIYEKGSFYSLLFLLAVSLIYYFVRLIPSEPDSTSKFISAMLFIWNPVNTLAVCCINYLPRVRWQKTDTRGRDLTCGEPLWECCKKNSNFFVYWSALLAYCFELVCKNGAIMLDVAQEIEPFLESNFSKSYSHYWGPMVIIIGFRLAFHARLLTFYWEKIFHGNKDLFAEPGDDLIKKRAFFEGNSEQRFEQIEMTERV